MTELTYKNQAYALHHGEHVLSCLLRHVVDYPKSCQAGICQSCLIKATVGNVEPSWQAGLPDTLKTQGYFLACLAKPSSNLQLESPDTAECDVDTVIDTIEPLSYNVIKVKLVVDNLQSWTPGKYLNLINPNGICRSYSIANIPSQDRFIEIHIKLCKDGAMSQWLQETAKIGMEIKIRGPFGKCYYYNPDKLNFDILLAGTGTGLAPLIAILKSALSESHHGRITLVHGGLTDADIYYVAELEQLVTHNKNFHYDPCVLKTEGRYPEGHLEKRIIMHLSNPLNTRVYLCGPEEITNKLKTKAFLAGVPSQHILSDAFL